MRDTSRSLQSKPEVLGGGFGPSGKDLFVRHAVKRVVDRHSRKPRGVVGQHLRGGKFGWIKAAAPFGVVVARGADPITASRLGRLRSTSTARAHGYRVYPCRALLASLSDWRS